MQQRADPFINYFRRPLCGSQFLNTIPNSHLIVMIEYEKLKEVLDFLHTPIRNGGAGMTVTEVSKLIGKEP